MKEDQVALQDRLKEALEEVKEAKAETTKRVCLCDMSSRICGHIHVVCIHVYIKQTLQGLSKLIQMQCVG